MQKQVDLLLVEDDDDLRLTLQEVLEDEGYSVAGSRNGAAALRLLHSGTLPRTIVTDLCMPEMDGWELAERVRGDPSFRSIPMLILSALDLDSSRTLPPGIGRLRKPVEVRCLLDILRELCGAPAPKLCPEP